MTTFSNLGIKRIERRFTGTKINKQYVIGKPIKILDFEICQSKKRQGTTYLKMQILLEGKKWFLSTGGKFLQETLKQVDRQLLIKEPIETRILKTNGYFYFEGTLVEDDEACNDAEATLLV